MRIVCLGDSLTQGDYGTDTVGVGDVREKNYPYFLEKLTGHDVINYGKCGFRSMECLRFYKKGNVDVSGADIILIMLGTNGSMSLEEDVEGNMAYVNIIEHCKKDAPGAEIILCVPPHVTEIPERVGYGCADKVRKAQAFVLKTAEDYGLRTIDFRRDNVFNAENEYIMQPNDGVHFGEIGYYTMAKYIGESLGLL